MVIQSGTLQSWQVGEAIKADKLNQPVHILRRMAGAGPANQVIGHPIPTGAGGGTTEKFRVMNDRDRGDGPRGMQDDYFYATRLSTGETRVKVAKPRKLRVRPWNNQTVFMDDLAATIEYRYPQVVYSPLNFNKRWATRSDQPNMQETQIIWPPYITDPHFFAPEDIIKAVMIGEEATGLDGIEWEDTNDSGRTWTLLPAAFE